MASALNRSYPEIQGEFELEDEFEEEVEVEAEDEQELEFEAEDEDEDFLGAIGGIGKALGGLLSGGGDGEYEAEFEFEAEAETEDEAEEEYEDEDFVNPIRRIYPDAELMAHLSAKAAQTSSEAEAEAFLGALVPIASKLIPRAAGVLARNAPALIRGTSALGRRLRRNPATRKYVMAMPVILQRTAQSLADQAAAGRSVSPETAISTMTRIAGRMFRQAPERNRAMRAVSTFDRRYRRRSRTPATSGVRRTRRPQPTRRRRARR
ncbi:hypothetical protein [Kribbella jiaozuonensis]|uniref:Uncharacterized protein n=1 Tax=Kribbella jiaozuonensis TaxID=2575441 RepID=A0A4U3LQ25_9ACTN|nr:hypothetical protein [Kribbella jiaozuonensis]TKK76457.1 hypothetical protein FDA38_29170 [Kribbella jiaozuonensis]